MIGKREKIINKTVPNKSIAASALDGALLHPSAQQRRVYGLAQGK